MMTAALTSTSESSIFGDFFKFSDSTFSISKLKTPFYITQINSEFYQKLSRLNELKQKANERFYKKSGEKLSEKQMNIIDVLADCNYSSKPLISFYHDKIKVQIDSGEIKYMIDFSTDFKEEYVLLGIMKSEKYSLKKVLLSELKNEIRG